MSKRLIITVTVILVIAMLGVGGYILLGNKASNSSQGNLDQNNNKTVKIERVTIGDITKSITGKGTIQTSELKDIATPVKSKISEVLVKAGAKVSKGDKLFALDEQELLNELEKAKGELTTAMRELGNSSPSYDYITIKAPKAGKVEGVNVSKKTKLGNIPAEKEAMVLKDANGQEIELIIPKSGEVTAVNAKQGKTVKAGDTLFKIKVPSGTFEKNIKKVEDAKAKVELIKKYIDNPVILSEFDGIVNEIKSPASNDSIDADTKVISIQLQSGYMLSIRITQEELDSVKMGQEANIEFESGLNVKGSIEHISYKADDNGQFVINISLEETDSINEVFPGVKASASIILEKSENVVRVPIEAVKQDKKGDYVMIYTGSEEQAKELDAAKLPMEKRYVERGLTNSLFAEIKSGVKDGEKVVVVKTSNNMDMYGGDMMGGIQTIVVE